MSSGGWKGQQVQINACYIGSSSEKKQSKKKFRTELISRSLPACDKPPLINELILNAALLERL